MRKLMMAFIAFFVIAVPINGALTNIADAASTRVAVIKELKGTVKVKKAGGAKEFTAFAKMSLNEGDVLSVGSGGSAMLQFANGTSEDDKMTVSANTRLSFSKLSSKKGTTTKVSMWSGNAWVDVKSIASVNDEFTLETPTAVMGVRGTHFFVNVNPLTGATNMTVAAGIVRTSPNGNATTGKQPTQNVYPAQQVFISPTQQGQPDLLKGPIDIQQIVSQSGPEIIKAFLLSAQDIVAENKSLMDTYLSQSSAGESAQEKERVRGNIENIVGAVASSVQKQTANKEIQDIITALNRIMDSLRELNLSAEDIAQSAKIKDKQFALQRQAEELRRQAELIRDKELRDKLREKQENQKKAAEEAIKKNQNKAYEQYESQLDELEKKRLRGERDKRLEENNAATPSTTTSGGNGSSGNPGPSPSESSQAGTLTSLRIIKYVGEASPPVEPPPSSTTIDLLPTFNSSTTNYTAQAASNVSYVYIRPVAADTSDTLTVNGSVVASGGYSVGIPLNIGNNVVTIVVTASSGTTKTYTVQISRVGTARLVDFDGLDLMASFNPEIFEYYGEVDTNYIVAITDPGLSVSVKLNGSFVPPYEASFMFKPSYLVGDDNLLEVTVTPEVGIPVTYTFHVLNANVVKLSSLTVNTSYVRQVDSDTYSGVVESTVTEVNLSVDTKVPTSLVQVSFNGTPINKGASGYSLFDYLSAGWNTFSIRVSDASGNLPARDYEMLLWKGEVLLTTVQSWMVLDNNGQTGSAESYSNNWEIWYLPGATSVTIMPSMDAASPFTVHSIEKYGEEYDVFYPASDGSFNLQLDNSSYEYGYVWLESDGKLIGRDITFKPDNVDFIYGLRKYGESSPPTAISDTSTTSIEMPVEATSFNFIPVFNNGTGGRVTVYDGGVPILPLDGFYSIPFDGPEKTFTIEYKSYGGLTQKTYTISLVMPSS